MAPRSGRRNMGWRKPPPRLSPQCSSASSYPSRGLRRLSLTININKDMPPLPTDWRETMEHAIKKERRQAVYVVPPPVPPKDDASDAASDAASRRESLAITLVEEEFAQVEDTSPVPPSQNDIREQIECVERAENRAQATPVVTKRASQKSLPKIYRPPTPPLPAQNPRLRSAGHHSRSSSDSQTHTLFQGLIPSEQREATPSRCPSVLTSWPSNLMPDVSVTLHSQASRSHILSLSDHDPHKQRYRHGSPRASRGSGVSTSTGKRSSAGRSQFTCHMCHGMWSALKSLGLHLRAKMTPSSKY